MKLPTLIASLGLAIASRASTVTFQWTPSSSTNIIVAYNLYDVSVGTTLVGSTTNTALTISNVDLTRQHSYTLTASGTNSQGLILTSAMTGATTMAAQIAPPGSPPKVTAIQ